MRVEFTREREDLAEFRGRMKTKIDGENQKQKREIAKIKEKYNKEGTQFIDDENEMGRTLPEGGDIGPKNPGDLPIAGYGHPVKYKAKREKAQMERQQQLDLQAETNPFTGLANAANNIFNQFNKPPPSGGNK